MTHTSFASLLLLTLPLFGSDEIQVPWQDVCRAADGHRLTIKSANGDVVDGYCMSINVDEMAITTKDHKIVRVARATLSRIDVQRSKNEGHQLAALHKEVHKSLRKGFEWLLSPSAPLGLIAIPSTLAWGIVSTPFCILGDVTHKASGTREIKVM